MQIAKPASVTIAGGSYSASVTAQLEGTTVGSTQQAAMGSERDFAPLIEAQDGASAAFYSDVGVSPSQKTYSGQTSSTKYAAKKQASSLTLYINGSAGSTATAGTQPTDPSTIRLGSHRDGRYLNGWISRVCLSASPTGCAP